MLYIFLTAEVNVTWLIVWLISKFLYALNGTFFSEPNTHLKSNFLLKLIMANIESCL